MLSNLVTNPAMESTSGTVEVRRNLVSNPIGPGAPTSGSTGWRSSPGDTGTFIVDGGLPAYGAEQGEAVTGLYVDPNENYTANVGDTIRLAIDVKTNSQALADTMRLRIASYSDAENDSPVETTPIPVNEWTRLSLSGVVTAAPDGGYFRTLVWPSGSYDMGTVLRVRRAVVEIGTGLPPDTDFYDGSTSPDPDLTACWTGLVNDSASVLTGAQVADLAASSPSWTEQPYRITEGSGHAARFKVVGSSAIRIPISNSLDLTPGETYTMMFEVRADTPLTNVSPRIQNSVGAPLFDVPANQWTPVRLTAVAGTSTWANTGAYLNTNVGQQPGTLIDIRYAMVTEGEYDGPYRDGDSYGWQWDGAPHQTGSTQFFAMNMEPVPEMKPVPHNRIVVEGLPDLTDAVTVNVLRMTQAGETAIRGGWQVTSTTTFTVDDVEAPFGVETRYRLELFDADGVSLGWTEPTDAIVLDFAGTVVHQVLDPTLALVTAPLRGAAMVQEREFEGSLVRPGGATRPVWIGEGRNARTGMELPLLTQTAEDEARLVALFENQLPVIVYRTSLPMRLPQPAHLLVRNPVMEGINWHAFKDATRWAFVVDEVQPPGLGLSRALLAWDDVMTAYPTWQAVMDSYASWASLMQDRSLIGRA